jgi:TolA-binding protein
MERKDYFAALGIYRQIDDIKHAGGVELLRFAQRALYEEAYRPAAEAFRELIASHPGAPYLSDAEYQYARCMEEMAYDPELPGALQGGGEPPAGAESAGSFDDVIRLYRQVAEKYPQNPVASDARYRIAWITYHEYHDNSAALAILDDLAGTRSRRQGKKDAMLLKGEVLMAQGRLDDGLAQYAAVLGEPALDPADRDRAMFQCAEGLYYRGDFDSCVTLLEPLIENSDRDIANDALTLITFVQRYRKPGEEPLKRYAEAEYYVRQRRVSEAVTLFEDIITTFPESELRDHAMLRAAELYEELRQPKKAEEQYLALINGIEDSILRDRAMYQAGQLYEETLKDHARAMELYQRILEAYPYSQYGDEARARILSLRKEQS